MVDEDIAVWGAGLAALCTLLLAVVLFIPPAVA